MEILKEIVLRDIKEENRKHWLKVIIEESGDITLDGLDVTSVAKDFFGDSAYDYVKTIKSKDVPLLREIFNIPEQTDILNYLKENFSGEKSFEFERILNEKDFPYELDVW